MTVRLFPAHETRDLDPPRKLTAKERALLDFLLRQDFRGRDKLRRQIDEARVAVECPQCAFIELVVKSSAPAADGERFVPAEAVGVADDGEPFAVLLHVDDGYLARVEFSRNDHLEVLETPDVARLTFQEPHPL